MGYYLVDGIYPSYGNLVAAPKQATTIKEKYFCTQQEACRKDMKRAFAEDERGVHGLENLSPYHPEDIATISRDTDIDVFNALFERRREIRNKDSSLQLRQDPINHHWDIKGNE
ncbi:hypothetical protein PHYBLDRAFT_150869 [Phycomyces blakesleeanus NRRL 1555(-)]|uniref:Uncharacterized protein n=1 Tax=Phycomyces blakesleeanus (strain ATCC 8743b / DSM 1359 / FGSC 10004 / NBRC 33097 / NRRL 1555) TaxID=763407 RepID=A0A167KIY8_PHYB8|nr:hypothetical protein PHYBLDRAFT_150869 [Phycomyces blakesleeanus NRRL 1555(-)]OAD68209.1 hypothetical protein PHYBLDRAFT_150869 [Phycomyces blakesleeanus NRRL 1555(-)]|eukprot:XP_018286249.1 hypothetical protein PHYBLDRAFT_150869 [Phycomyces blakesleeanus NRRL 1555(-)]